MKSKLNLKFGTCSWKYDSWRGLVYSNDRDINYLKEYSARYNSVEVDQWFWSLHSPESISLPREKDVADYTASVPDDFKFTIKVPNSITLTHHYKKAGETALKPNPYFLSDKLFEDLIQLLSPMKKKIGALIFQFEYLNKQKMSGLDEFIKLFSEFSEKIPHEIPLAIETRNPNFLNSKFFSFLREVKAAPVFLQGYYMPPVFPYLDTAIQSGFETIIIRLHGPNRADIEERTGSKWDSIVEPKTEELGKLSLFIKSNISRKLDLYINVNNHYEGSAPLTIGRINELIEAKET